MKSNLQFGAAALVIACGPAAASAETTWVANCYPPPQHVVCKDILKPWADAVADATEGRVKVRIMAKSMAPPPDQLTSIRGAVFDVAVQYNGFIEDELVGPAVAHLPFTSLDDAAAASVALWDTYQKYFSGVDELPGVELLGLWVSPGADFYAMTDPPIASVGDLAARKMWALPGPPATILKQLGSPIVSGPAAQMAEMVQRRVVDGFVGIPAAALFEFSLPDYVTSVTRTERKLFAPSFSLLLSDEKWAELSDEDRAAISAVSNEVLSRNAGAAWQTDDRVAVEKLNATKTIHIGDAAFEAELGAAAAGYAEAWKAKATAKGFDAEGALNFYTARVRELTAAE